MLMQSVVRWFGGYSKISCEAGNGTRILNIMLRCNIEYWGLRRKDDGSFELYVTQKEYKKLVSLLDKYSIKVYSVRGRGLPFVCKAHKNRIGLIIGLVLFFVIIMLSSLFVWDIKIVSQTDIPQNEILSNLAQLGCYEGSFVPAMDFEDLCIDYVNCFKHCSWISVNLRGTVAYVEIREKQVYDEPENEPRNLVAKCDGVIESYSVYSGKSCVKPGNIVKKGDLLISGMVSDKDNAVRLCHAEGNVMATVEKELKVSVPYSHSEKIYTGQNIEKRKLRFFNIIIPLGGNEPNDSGEYSYSQQTDTVVLFEKIELPLSIEKEVYSLYRVEEMQYTKKQAEYIAQREMRALFESQLPNAHILSVETGGTHAENEYLLTCRVRCSMDITEASQIMIK